MYSRRVRAWPTCDPGITAIVPGEGVSSRRVRRRGSWKDISGFPSERQRRNLKLKLPGFSTPSPGRSTGPPLSAPEGGEGKYPHASMNVQAERSKKNPDRTFFRSLTQATLFPPARDAPPKMASARSAPEMPKRVRMTRSPRSH